MKFVEFCESHNSLFQQLVSLKPNIVQAAQKIYDDWDSLDPDNGGGGICDEIANQIGDIIVSSIPNVEITAGGQDGDDHAYVIAYNDHEAYSVDIPPDVYETGGGYCWQKILDVEFQPDDITIDELPRSWIEPESY